MKFVASFLSGFYRLKYSLSTSKDREKYLLHSTNLYMQARNRPLILKQGPRFISDEDLRRVPCRQVHKKKTIAPPNSGTDSRPSLDIFRDNIALFLTYPEK